MFASFPMYDLPEVRAHTDALWAAIAGRLAAGGMADVPAQLARPDGPLAAHWREDGLLLSHTCGYPVVRELPDAFVLGSFSVCSGDPDHPGRYSTYIVARTADERTPRGLAAYDGAVAAINDDGSLSGWVSLGVALHGAGVRPSRVLATGAHANSLPAIQRGEADVASIDSHTYALLAANRPQVVEGISIVGRGPDIGFTPLITSRREWVEPMRAAVAGALDDLRAGDPKVLSALMITGWVPTGREAFGDVAQLATIAGAVLG